MNIDFLDSIVGCILIAMLWLTILCAVEFSKLEKRIKQLEDKIK